MSMKYMRKFDPTLEKIKLSGIVKISEEVDKIAQEYNGSFIRLHRGDIDVQTPNFLISGIKEGLDKGLTKYPKTGGNKNLRKLIAGEYDLYEDNVILTYGGQEALQLACRVFPGSNILALGPIWSCMLDNQVPYAHSNISSVPFVTGNGNLDVDFSSLENRLKENDIDILYFNNPHNPTGKVFSEEETRKIVNLATLYGLLVLADESYDKIVFDGRKHFSTMNIAEDNILLTNTASKRFAFTGGRVGYLATRDRHLARLLPLMQYTQTAGLPPFIQHGLEKALEDPWQVKKWEDEMLKIYQERRDILFESLKDLNGKNSIKPQGAFYDMRDLSQFIPENIMDPVKHIRRAFESNGLSVCPAAYFGINGDYINSVRVSFSQVSAEQLKEVGKRIPYVIEDLTKNER